MHHDFPSQLGQALLMAFGMFWDVGWSLVLGFTISAAIQAFVSTEQMRRAFGRDGFREIALATIAGAVSSSCSYASAAITRSLFKKGAALIPSLAFLFASTNLVIELGIILYLLMGWQFTAAEWVGGVVLIAIMTALVRLTHPARLVEEARHHPETAGGHEHESTVIEGDNLWQKLKHLRARVVIAQNFAMDWSMLWKDLLAGFFIIAEKQYGFGDLVSLTVTGIAAEARGTVENVTLRVTRLRSTDGEVLTIPNGQIVKTVNLSKDWARAVVDIPVSTSADLNRVNEVLHQECEHARDNPLLGELLLDAPTVMGVERIEVDTVTLRVVARTLPGKQFEAGRQLRVLVIRALARAGIVTAADATVGLVDDPAVPAAEAAEEKAHDAVQQR